MNVQHRDRTVQVFRKSALVARCRPLTATPSKVKETRRTFRADRMLTFLSACDSSIKARLSSHVLDLVLVFRVASRLLCRAGHSAVL